MNTSELTGLTQRTLGHFQLVRETGRGGMSVVYEAIDTRLGRTVALKVLHAPPSTLTGEGEMVARMQREARAIASLSHPNVITIYDVGEHDGWHYMAMEFLDGITLRERLNHSPLTPYEAADVLRQVADGLDAVHRQGVTHRDIKASNVMLLYNGRVKLLDFGIARFADDSTLTQTGSMVGSPAYMAPELLTGGKAAPTADIWALGVLLYEMLSNRLPFAAESLPRVVYRVAHDSPDPLPNISPEIQAVLDQALNKSPSERFPTARALAEAFGRAAEAEPDREQSELTKGRDAAVAPAEFQDNRPDDPSPNSEMEKTLLAPVPVASMETERAVVPVRAKTKPRRRSAVLPLALGFALVYTVIIAAYLWRHSAANPKPQQAPVTAATHPEAAKNVPVSGSAPATVAKIPPPREDERAGRPAVSTRRQRTPRTTSFRNSAPRTASTANAGSTTMRRVRAASADTVRKPQANNAPAVRPRTRETVQVRRNPTVEQPNADRTEQPEVVRNTPSVGIRNADLGAEEKSTARMDLQERLDGWIAATNAADIGEQMRYYSPSLSAFYLKRNVTTNAVRAEKTRLFARASDVDVWVDEPKIKLSEDGKTATMRFRKQYNIENGRRSRRGAVVQELQWKRDGDDWKIVSERDLRVLR